MANFVAKAKRGLFIAYLIAIHGVLIWLLLDKFVLQRLFEASWSAGNVEAPISGPQVEPATLPSITPSPGPEPTVEPSLSPPPPLAIPGRLLVPVQGVMPDKLTDTFNDARSDGRTHEAIDIPAPAGTPVLAAADGTIVKFFDSELGGTTIYQISADGKYFFYYAHLQSRAAGIAEKQFVPRGTTIGYVGDTGNAGLGNYHLHFSITAVVDPNRFWEGISINPYPILKGETDLR